METDEMTDKIKQTDASNVARQKRQKEIEGFLDDLISKIVETFEQTDRSEEQATNTKDLLKELNKPSELFKRINDIDIGHFLDRNQSVNLQASEEETIMNDSLVLEESVANCVKDLIENIIKIVDNEKENSRQSISKSSANNTKLGCIDTNVKVSGEQIIKEMKMVQKMEEMVKKIIKEVLENLDNNCLEFDNKSSEKFKIPTKALDKTSQQNLPKTAQQSVDGIKECLPNPHQAEMLKSYLEQPNKCEFFQQPNILSDGLQQSNVSSDCLQQSPMSTDCLNAPDLQKAIQLSKCLKQEITSTGSLGQASMSPESLYQTISEGTVQHESTSTSSLQLTNTSGNPLNQTSARADSFQQASASTNPIGQACTHAHSFIQEIEKNTFLKETIETAYQVFEHQTNINSKTRRAASLIKYINERSRQSNKNGLDILQEIQNMIEIINGVGDLNEHLQSDIRKIFLENRELKRMSNYIYEHLATIGYCRSEEFIEKEAFDTIKNGLSVCSEIQFVKLQMGKLFRDFFLIQRNFLIHSLKFLSIPYELIIGDNRFTRLLSNVKASVIGICGMIFSIEEFDDLYESALSDYKNVVRLVEKFTESVVLLDHKPDTKMDEEK